MGMSMQLTVWVLSKDYDAIDRGALILKIN